MKRVFSLALALVMAVSLVTIGTVGASAANFSDGSSIVYKEAVDVMSALEIIGGYSDGSFRPENYLSRGAAAKIICNMMLGPAIANQMKGTATDFSDVPADNTFSGYVGWCVSHGIVSGYSDGTFKPFDRLSGFAFLKMLLCALGYDQTMEGYTGKGWSSNVQIQALKIGLDNGLHTALDGSQPVTRDAACLFAFNTLQSDEVEYTGTTASTCRTRTWGANAPSYGSNISAAARAGENIRQFAEDHFNTLVKNPANFTGTDAFARPATSWSLRGSVIGTYHADVSRTYYGDVTMGTLYTDLGLSSAASNVSLYLNGVQDGNAALEIKSGSTVSLSDASGAAASAIGPGTEIQVFRDSLTNSVTICAISLYVGTVSSVHTGSTASDRYVVVSGSVSNPASYPAELVNGSNNQFKTDQFEKDDIVAFTYSEKAGESQPIQSVVKLDNMRGTTSRKTAGTSVELGGVTCYYGRKIAFEGTLAGNEGSIKATGGDYTIYYVDQDGSRIILWIEDTRTTAANAYALLTAFQSATSFSSAQARLVFADGSIANVTANRDSDSFNPTSERDDEPVLIRYTSNTDGSYTLKKLTGAESAASSVASIRNRTAIGLSGIADDTSIPADDDTTFVVQEGDSFRIYTGIRNVPNVTSGGSLPVRSYTYYSNGVARVVYLLNGTTSTTSRELMFIAAASASSVVSDSSSASGYRTFNALLGGRIVSIRVEVGSTMGSLTVTRDSSFKPSGADSVLLNSSNFNANGIYISGTYTGSAVTANKAQGFTTPSGGFLKIGTKDENGNAAPGTRLPLASDVEVYTVTSKGVISETTANRLSGNDDDWVFYTVADGEVTTLIIVK